MKWSWKKKTDIFIFTLIGTFFGINTLINMHIDDDIFTKYEIISLILVFMGYICLFIFNFRKKWIFGILVVTLLIFLSVYRIWEVYYHMKIKKN